MCGGVPERKKETKWSRPLIRENVDKRVDNSRTPINDVSNNMEHGLGMFIVILVRWG